MKRTIHRVIQSFIYAVPLLLSFIGSVTANDCNYNYRISYSSDNQYTILPAMSNEPHANLGSAINGIMTEINNHQQTTSLSICIDLPDEGVSHVLGQPVNILSENFSDPSGVRDVIIHFRGGASTNIDLRCGEKNAYCPFGFRVSENSAFANDNARITVSFSNLTLEGGPAFYLNGSGSPNDDPQLRVRQVRIINTTGCDIENAPAILVQKDEPIDTIGTISACSLNMNPKPVLADDALVDTVDDEQESNPVLALNDGVQLHIEQSSLFNLACTTGDATCQPGQVKIDNRNEEARLVMTNSLLGEFESISLLDTSRCSISESIALAADASTQGTCATLPVNSFLDWITPLATGAADYRIVGEEANNPLLDRGVPIDDLEKDLAGNPRIANCGLKSQVDLGVFEYQYLQAKFMPKEKVQGLCPLRYSQSDSVELQINFDQPATCLESRLLDKNSALVNQLLPIGERLRAEQVVLQLSANKQQLNITINDLASQLNGDRGYYLALNDQAELGIEAEDCRDALVYFPGNRIDAALISGATINMMGKNYIDSELIDSSVSGSIDPLLVGQIEVCADEICERITVGPHDSGQWSLPLTSFVSETSKRMTFTTRYFDREGQLLESLTESRVLGVYTQSQNVVRIEVSEQPTLPTSINFSEDVETLKKYFRYRVVYRSPIKAQDKSKEFFLPFMIKGFFRYQLSNAVDCTDEQGEAEVFSCDFWLIINEGMVHHLDMLLFTVAPEKVNASQNPWTKVDAEAKIIEFEEQGFGNTTGGKPENISDQLGSVKNAKLNRVEISKEGGYLKGLTQHFDNDFVFSANQSGATEQLELSDDECITSVKVWKYSLSNSYITGMDFETNKGRRSIRADKQNDSHKSRLFVAPPGFHINGFDGRYGWIMDSIKPHYAPLPDSCLGRENKIFTPHNITASHSRTSGVTICLNKSSHSQEPHEWSTLLVNGNRIKKKYEYRFNLSNAGGVGQIKAGNTTCDNYNVSRQKLYYEMQYETKCSWGSCWLSETGWESQGSWTNDGSVSVSRTKKYHSIDSNAYIQAYVLEKSGTSTRKVSVYDGCGHRRTEGTGSGTSYLKQADFNAALRHVHRNISSNPVQARLPGDILTNVSHRGKNLGIYCGKDITRSYDARASRYTRFIDGGLQNGEYLKGIRFSQSNPAVSSDRHKIRLKFQKTGNTSIHDGNWVVARPDLGVFSGAACVTTASAEKRGSLCNSSAWTSTYESGKLIAPPGYYIEGIYTRESNNSGSGDIRLIGVKFAPFPWVELESEYTHWNSGEPNNLEEQCAESYGNGWWNDQHCNQSRYFACRHLNDPFDWQLSLVQGPWADGHEACLNLNSGSYRFAKPRTDQENAAMNALSSSRLWLNYKRSKDNPEEWAVGSLDKYPLYLLLLLCLLWGRKSREL